MSYNIDRITGAKTVEVFKDYKEYRVSPGCKGICEYSELAVSPPRFKGYSSHQDGIRYCKRCSKYFKKEAGVRCPCCNVLTSARRRSKQSRVWREKQREEALSRQLSRSDEELEVQRAISNTYYWYKCRSQCDFKTDNWLEAREHKEHGHGIKRVPVLIHNILAQDTKEETHIQNVQL